MVPGIGLKVLAVAPSSPTLPPGFLKEMTMGPLNILLFCQFYDLYLGGRVLSVLQQGAS